MPPGYDSIKSHTLKNEAFRSISWLCWHFYNAFILKDFKATTPTTIEFKVTFSDNDQI